MIDTSQNMLYHIDNLNSKSEKISYQMASGRAINQGSDDALLHAQLINLDDKLRVTEGLKLQIEKTRALNDTADNNMAETKVSLEAIKIDLLKSLNAGMDRSDKLALAANLIGIRENLYDRVNENLDGEFLFTGSVTTVQPMVRDTDFHLNGQIDFEGDGFLRKIAVQPGSYRDRGITAYDVIFYNNTTATAGNTFTFSEGENIIDEDGKQWKVMLDPDGDGKNYIQQHDKDGQMYDHNIYTDARIEIDTIAPQVQATATNMAVQTQYTINNLPATPEGRLLEAKHNYFDDLNITINALEGYATKLDGTKGVVISNDEVSLTLRYGLESTSKQFDATNVGHGELGGRNNVFEVAYDKITVQESHYNILIQEWGGADLAKLAMESKSLELTYQALYTTIGKMNQLSLVNFIK